MPRRRITGAGRSRLLEDNPAKGMLAEMHPLDKAALATAVVPGVGDALGVLADARMYAQEPEERTWGNYLLSAVGALPFIPSRGATKAVSEGLDMSKSARMQRAEDMGFDTRETWYHGTNADISDFDIGHAGKYSESGNPLQGKGIYLTDDPKAATKYATGEVRNTEALSPSIYPSMVSGNIFDATDFTRSQELELLENLPANVKASFVDWIDDAKNTTDTDWIADDSLWPEIAESLTDAGIDPGEYMKSLGYDGVISKEMLGSDFMHGGDIYKTMTVFDPSKIRSVNAAFDPSKASSANILAGMAGGAIGLGVLADYIQEDDKQYGYLSENL